MLGVPAILTAREWEDGWDGSVDGPGLLALEETTESEIFRLDLGIRVLVYLGYVDFALIYVCVAIEERFKEEAFRRSGWKRVQELSVQCLLLLYPCFVTCWLDTPNVKYVEACLLYAQKLFTKPSLSGLKLRC